MKTLESGIWDRYRHCGSVTTRGVWGCERHWTWLMVGRIVEMSLRIKTGSSPNRSLTTDCCHGICYLTMLYRLQLLMLFTSNIGKNESSVKSVWMNGIIVRIRRNLLQPNFICCSLNKGFLTHGSRPKTGLPWSSLINWNFLHKRFLLCVTMGGWTCAATALSAR
jgi:hypothetical protein